MSTATSRLATLSAVALVVGGLAQFAASTAGASGTTNTFVFKGA